MNKLALGTMLTLAVLGVGYIYVSNDGADQMAVDNMAEKEMAQEEDMVSDDMAATKDNMKSDGVYEVYSPDKLARTDSGEVVLFFKASWCPTCRALDLDIKDSLDDIPDGVSILEVNYDAATDLRQKYGVTNQHTLVQVDADGNLVKKWSGGLNLETVLEQLI
jgi:thiol-disulfide isomerase/thioredoxin